MLQQHISIDTSLYAKRERGGAIRYISLKTTPRSSLSLVSTKRRRRTMSSRHYVYLLCYEHVWL